MKTFAALPVVAPRPHGLRSFGVSVAVVLGSVGFAAGCAHDAKPPVSSAEVTTTSATVAAATPGFPGSGPASERAEARAIGSSLDPDAPTSARVPTRLIADAPALGVREEGPTPPLARWSGRYPDAARMLAAWTREHEATARELGRWAAREPIQMKTFVDWAITNESETVNAFFFGRSAFTELRRVTDADRPAVDAFVVWIRSARPAAKELVVHPSGLAFAANHEEQFARARADRAEEADEAAAAP